MFSKLFSTAHKELYQTVVCWTYIMKNSVSVVLIIAQKPWQFSEVLGKFWQRGCGTAWGRQFSGRLQVVSLDEHGP